MKGACSLDLMSMLSGLNEHALSTFQYLPPCELKIEIIYRVSQKFCNNFF